MIIPRRVRRGEKITAQLFNQLVDAIIERTPRRALNARLRTGRDGFAYSPAAGDPTPPPEATLQFFQLVDATTFSEDGTPTYKIRVVRSTFDGDAPDFPSADHGFSDGDNPPCVFTVSSGGVLYGKAIIDQTAATPDAVVTSTEFDFAASKPDDASDGTEKSVQIGSWSIDTEAKKLSVSNDVFGPITINVCRLFYVPDHSPKWGITFVTGTQTA